MAQEVLGGMPDGDGEAPATGAPPYISFLTILNCFDWLGQEGIPHRFDRSFWQRKYSGSVGPQLISALRFLGLLEGDRPTVRLHSLAEASGDDRKEVLQEAILDAYRHVDFELLPKATPDMLSEWIANYPVTGDTRRKSESFLINALKYVDHPLSASIKKLSRNRKPGTRRATPKKAEVKPNPPAEEEEKEKVAERTEDQNFRIVKLASGGEVSVAINVDLLRLSENDRDWLIGLVDQIRAYTDPSKEDNDEEANQED